MSEHGEYSDVGAACDARYGSNPDACYQPAGHAGSHSNQWGTTWVSEHEHAAPRPDEATDCTVCARLGYAIWGASNFTTTSPPNPSTNEGEQHGHID